MATASPFRVAPYAGISKFLETRPSPTSRRDEKIRNVARSVQEITESEEEEDDSQLSMEVNSARSPFARIDPQLPSGRCSSFSSPSMTRSAGAKRLARGFSAPCILRPSLVAQPLSPKIQDDHLGLPPIPEASTPITPIMPKLIETSVEERQEDHILNEKHR
ncbi:hypothetical protein Q1695_012358 [Nippostrongylus brasiliensis]|nr:hypothetical protein Q1695_012358 [Nippostrongylus brasiliensis]